MGSLRPQNQKCNQTMDGLAPSPKSGLDPTQPIDPATKHTVDLLDVQLRIQEDDAGCSLTMTSIKAVILVSMQALHYIIYFP